MSQSSAYNKASGRGVVELSGKQHYLGKFGTAERQAAYNKAVGEWLANGKRPLQVVVTTAASKPSGGLVVVEVVERYLEHARTYYLVSGKHASGHQRAKIAARVLQKHYSTTLASEFGSLKHRTVQQLLVESGRGRGYINAHLHDHSHVPICRVT